jgi:hypothetical protein
MIPTVRIISPVSEENPLGFVVINESDFDPDQHELFDARQEPDAAQKPLGIKALRDELTARGIAFDADAKKADLQALLDAAQ